MWSVDCTEKAAEIIHSLFFKQVKLLNDKRALNSLLFICIFIAFFKDKKLSCGFIYIYFFSGKSGGIVLEEALDLSSDRLLNNNNKSNNMSKGSRVAFVMACFVSVI